MPRTLIIDNFDSFTQNLVHATGSLGARPTIVRNTACDASMLRREAYTHVMIGPGPGHPSVARDIGRCAEIIQACAEDKVPLLGVCLGHQLLGALYGATVRRAPRPMHGRASTIRIMQPTSPLFRALDASIIGMRYHSLCITHPSPALRTTAMSDDGVIMAIEHAALPFYGIQFHPESIGTPNGMTILNNFFSVS